MRVSSEEEFADAVERGEEEIEVVGEYADKVDKIAGISPAKWSLVLGGLGVGVGLAPFTGGLSLAAGLLPMGLGLGVASLGVSTAIGALVAIGGVTLLNNVRKYKVTKRGPNSVVLKKRA